MHVVIIGAGASGLAAAYRLSEFRKDLEITILENENDIGGMVNRLNVNWDGKKYFIERVYHHILDGDKTTLDFIKKLGLEKNFHLKRVKQGFLYNWKVYGFSTPVEILKFPISVTDKIRLAKFTFLDSKRKDWGPLEKITAKDWITEKAGKINYDVFFERLIWNKFHMLPDKISAPWLGTRLLKESSSFMKKFGWLENGESAILYNIAEILKSRGVKIITGTKIYKTESKSKKDIYFSSAGKHDVIHADVVISTTAPNIFLKLFPETSDDLKRKFNKIEYLSCICLSAGVRKKFTDRYWINVLEKNVPVSAIFCRSNLYDDSSPDGKAAYYLITYMKHGEDFWKKSDEELKQLYLDFAEKVFPGFKENLDWAELSRFEWAEAIYDMNYENPPITDGNGFYFAGVYRFFPKIRNLASALESGTEAAEKILEDYKIKSF